PDGHDRSGENGPALLSVEEVVEAGDEKGQSAEGEVQDARRGVGDNQTGRRDGVDPTEYKPGDHEFEHPPPCSATARCYGVLPCGSCTARTAVRRDSPRRVTISDES